LIFQGRKIEAIKIHRISTGTGLAEAKAAVEALEKELREKSPENFHAAADKRGCLGLLVFVAGAVLVFFSVFWLIPA